MSQPGQVMRIFRINTPCNGISHHRRFCVVFRLVNFSLCQLHPWRSILFEILEKCSGLFKFFEFTVHLNQAVNSFTEPGISLYNSFIKISGFHKLSIIGERTSKLESTPFIVPAFFPGTEIVPGCIFKLQFFHAYIPKRLKTGSE